MNITYEEFNWELYREINDDLQNLNTKNDAWEHWINHGQYEERPLSIINNTCIHKGRFGNLFFINISSLFI